MQLPWCLWLSCVFVITATRQTLRLFRKHKHEPPTETQTSTISTATSKQKRKMVINMLHEAGACRLELKLAHDFSMGIWFCVLVIDENF
jgi:hypothetical protein